MPFQCNIWNQSYVEHEIVDDIEPGMLDDIILEVLDDFYLYLKWLMNDVPPKVVDDGNDEKESCKAGCSDGASDPIVLVRKVLL